MNRIDNPLDVAIAQLAENPENTTLEIALKLATAIPAVAIADAIRDHFLNRRRFERVTTCARIRWDGFQCRRI